MELDGGKSPKKIGLWLDVGRGKQTRKSIPVVRVDKGLDTVSENSSENQEEKGEILDDDEEQSLSVVGNIGSVLGWVLAVKEDDVDSDKGNSDDSEDEVEDGEATNRPGGDGGRGKNPGNDLITEKWNNREKVENDEGSPIRHVSGNDDVTGESDSEREEEDRRTSKPDKGLGWATETGIRNYFSAMEESGKNDEISTEHVKKTKEPDEVAVENDGDELGVLDFEVVSEETKKEKTRDELQNPEKESDESEAVTEMHASDWEGDEIVLKQKNGENADLSLKTRVD